MKMLRRFRSHLLRAGISLGILLSGAALPSISFASCNTDPPPQKAKKKKCKPCEKDRRDCEKNQAGDPFYLDTGEFYLDKTFLRQESIVPMEIGLYYSTFSDLNGPVGYGWALNYGMRAFRDNEGSWVVRDDSGMLTHYVSAGENVFRSPGLRYKRLTVNPDGSSELRTRDQTQYHFDIEGRLSKIADGKGGELRMTYDENELFPIMGVPRYTHNTDLVVVAREYRLIYVEEYLVRDDLIEEATGRFFSVSYNENGDGRIAKIEDQSGRELVFTYDDDWGQLTGIQDPGGHDWEFTYYPENGLMIDDYKELARHLMKTFRGLGCGDCVVRQNYYERIIRGNRAVNRIEKQVQGANGQGEEIHVSYANRSTVHYIIKDGQGIKIAERTEQIDWITDALGESRVSKVEVELGGSLGHPGNEVTQYFYYGANSNAPGRTWKEHLPNGSVIEYEYDDNGNVTKETQTVEEGVNLVREMEYDARNSVKWEQVWQTDRPGEIFRTEFEYDNWNRLRKEKQKKDDGSFAVTEFVYYLNGLLKKEIDPCGRVKGYVYDTAGRVLYELDYDPTGFDPENDPFDAAYSYDEYGYREKMTDALGRETTYFYDALGRLLLEIDPIDQETEYFYNGANLEWVETASTATEPGRRTRYEYDGLNRRTKVIRMLPKIGLNGDVMRDGDGNVVWEDEFVLADEFGPKEPIVQSTRVYDSQGNPLHETNALDQTTTFQYDLLGRRTKMSEPFLNGQTSDRYWFYDPAGRVIREIDPARVVTRIAYDGLDREIRRVEAVGTDLERTISYNYNALGDVVSTTWSNNGESYTVEYEYNLLGQQIGISGDRELPMTFEYSDCGDLTVEIDRFGNKTEYVYDTHGRQRKIIHPPTAEFPGGTEDEVLYDEAGNVITRIDGRGIETHYHYDALNRLIFQSVPVERVSGIPDFDGTPDLWWETTTNVLRANEYESWGRITNIQPISGASNTTDYDRLGRRVRTESSGTGGAPGLEINYRYNAADQVTRIVYPEVNPDTSPTGPFSPVVLTYIDYAYDPANTRLLTSITDRAGNPTTFGYNKRFERVTETNGMGSTTVRSYDALGRLARERNHLGEVTVYQYDLFGQLVKVFHPDHEEGVTERIETRKYDNYGRLIEHFGTGAYPVVYAYDVEEGGAIRNKKTMTTFYGDNDSPATTAWEYDSRNRVKKKIHDDWSEYEYTYDEAGNLKTRKDAKGLTTTYHYNQFNALRLTEYANDPDVEIGYDELGRRTSVTVDSVLEQEWEYYPSGQIKKHTQHPVGYVLEYTYTPEGNREYRTVTPIVGGTAWVVDYAYDFAGRLEAIGDPWVSQGPFVYSYRSDSNLLSERLNPGGSKEVRDWDDLGRLTGIEGLDSLGVSMTQHIYSYNAAGQRKGETLLDGTTRAFDYDEKRQLVSASKTVPDIAYDLEYEYDELGNRLKEWTSGNSLSYTPNSLNQYAAIDVDVPVYDLNGNLTSHDGVTYVWSEENRLVELTSSFHESLYEYDGLGKRISRFEYANAVLQEEVHYVYDGKLPILEVDGSGNMLRSYTRGLDVTQTLEGAGGVGSLLSMTVHDSSAGSVGSYFYFYDGNGNVVALLDINDSVSASYAYSPFGERISAAGPMADHNPYQFSTKERDENRGLYYYLYRFYDPAHGRWLNRDPIEEAGGLNLYGFAGNDPVDRWDYLGQYALSFEYMFAPPFSDYDGGGFTWSQERKNAVVSAHLRARQLAPRAHSSVSRYLRDIPRVYCNTKGRKKLSTQVRYTKDTISRTQSAMYSGRRLDIAPAIWAGGASADNNDASMFVSNSSRKLWVLELFFQYDLNQRAATFFHEVTHLIGRTPGDNYFKEGGHHKVGVTYEDLLLSFTYEEVRTILQRNINHINGEILASGNKKDLIRRRDGNAN